MFFAQIGNTNKSSPRHYARALHCFALVLCHFWHTRAHTIRILVLSAPIEHTCCAPGNQLTAFVLPVDVSLIAVDIQLRQHAHAAYTATCAPCRCIRVDDGATILQCYKATKRSFTRCVCGCGAAVRGARVISGARQCQPHDLFHNVTCCISNTSAPPAFTRLLRRLTRRQQ